MSPQVEPVRDKFEWQRKIRSTPSWYVNSFPQADRQCQRKNETVWPGPSGDGELKPELLGRNALSFRPVNSRFSSSSEFSASTSGVITQPLYDVVTVRWRLHGP